MDGTMNELERLAILNEECGEVIQIISKIIRHGSESYNPNDVNKISNKVLLQQEIADVLYAIGLVVANKQLDVRAISVGISDKEKSIRQYLHQPQPKENWIKDLIHHRDTTIGLLATDWTIEKIVDKVIDDLGVKVNHNESALHSRGQVNGVLKQLLKDITFTI